MFNKFYFLFFDCLFLLLLMVTLMNVRLLQQPAMISIYYFIFQIVEKCDVGGVSMIHLPSTVGID